MRKISPKRIHILVFGKVQGVSFRAWILKEARKLGLSGWVRNTFSGQVEVLAQGPEDRLESLVRLCAEGSPGSTVSDIRSEWLESEDMAQAFEIIG